MTADGVSLPTTIAQMGSVAKTQAKGQQTAQQVAPFADQLDKKDDLKVQRVKETSKAKDEKIDPDQDKGKDKRRRRRFRRNRNLLAAKDEENPSEDNNSEESESEDQEKVGLLIDLRA